MEDKDLLDRHLMSWAAFFYWGLGSRILFESDYNLIKGLLQVDFVSTMRLVQMPLSRRRAEAFVKVQKFAVTAFVTQVMWALNKNILAMYAVIIYRSLHFQTAMWYARIKQGIHVKRKYEKIFYVPAMIIDFFNQSSQHYIKIFLQLFLLVVIFLQLLYMFSTIFRFSPQSFWCWYFLPELRRLSKVRWRNFFSFTHFG